MNSYFERQIEGLLFNHDEKKARRRTKWPNPNMDAELEQKWKAYKKAYARAVYHPNDPTETGITAWEDQRQKWILFKEAVANESHL